MSATTISGAGFVLAQGDCMPTLQRMRADSVDLVLTDIPYGEVNRKSSGLRNLDKGAADTLTFDLHDFTRQLIRVCRGSFYVFCGIEQVSPLARYFTEAGLTIRHGVWRKTNPSPMNGTRLWLSGTENCIFARKAKATFNEHCKSAVWDSPSGRSKQHPTEKPLALFRRLVEASSNPGDTVLDPCMGGGTTGVACRETRRRFIGVELCPEYYEIAQARVGSAGATT